MSVPEAAEDRTHVLADIRKGECHWPIGAPPNNDGSLQVFCCRPAKSRRTPYCPVHNRAAYAGGRR